MLKSVRNQNKNKHKRAVSTEECTGKKQVKMDEDWKLVEHGSWIVAKLHNEYILFELFSSNFDEFSIQKINKSMIKCYFPNHSTQISINNSNKSAPNEAVTSIYFISEHKNLW